MGHSFGSEHAVHHVNHTVTGVIVHVDDVGHGEDASQGYLALLSCYKIQIIIPLTAHLVGEGGHGDSLPGAGDQGGGAGREVTRVQGAPGHVSQEDRLQSHAVR